MGEAAAANRLPPEMRLPPILEPMFPIPLLRKLPSLPRSPGSEGAWVGAGAGAGVYTTGGAGLRVVTTTVLKRLRNNITNLTCLTLNFQRRILIFGLNFLAFILDF